MVNESNIYTVHNSTDSRRANTENAKRVHQNKYKEKHEQEVQNLNTTPGNQPTLLLRELSKHIYTPEEISRFSITEAIDHHPLAKRPASIRSKLAYREILTNLSATKRYLLPGWVVCFQYAQPKYAEDLEFYDKMPLVLFLGITKTNDGNIREVGLNLHYFPPYTRERILINTYKIFKSYFEANFNDPAIKPNQFISWDALNHIMRKDAKLAFGIKMYIPVLRGASYPIPARMLPTAFYTEGLFSKATRGQVQHFWRSFSRLA